MLTNKHYFIITTTIVILCTTVYGTYTLIHNKCFQFDEGNDFCFTTSKIYTPTTFQNRTYLHGNNTAQERTIVYNETYINTELQTHEIRIGPPSYNGTNKTESFIIHNSSGVFICGGCQ